MNGNMVILKNYQGQNINDLIAMMKKIDKNRKRRELARFEIRGIVKKKKKNKPLSKATLEYFKNKGFNN